MKRMVEMLRSWLEGRELDAMSEAERDRMLGQVGLSDEDLAAAKDGGAHVAKLLPAMLARNGLDAEAILAELGPLMHDLQRVCGGCRDARKCARMMDAQSSLDELLSICPNAHTIGSLEGVAKVTK